MILYTADNLGCVYSIDSEGTLFYTPQFTDGTVNIEDWCEVDFMALMGEEEECRSEIDAIHEKLIAMSKLMGEYYQK